VRLATAGDSGSQLRFQVFRQLVKLGIAVNFNSLLGGIANHIAVVAPGEVLVKFCLRSGVEHAVEVVG
jgi:hypothetical protein